MAFTRCVAAELPGYRAAHFLSGLSGEYTTPQRQFRRISLGRAATRQDLRPLAHCPGPTSGYSQPGDRYDPKPVVWWPWSPRPGERRLSFRLASCGMTAFRIVGRRQWVGSSRSVPAGPSRPSAAPRATLDSRHPSVQRRAASACSQSLTLSPGALGSAAFARFRAIWRKPLPLLGFSVNPVFSWTASFPWLSVPRELAHKVSLCF